MKLVVVGNGMATDAFLESFFEQPPAIRSGWEIAVFGEEPSLAYNRILLVDVLTGRKSEEAVLLKKPEWFSSNRVQLKSGKRIAEINPGQKTVLDSDGNETSYDSLILAVGARPFMPPVPGVDKRNVCVLRTLEDVRSVLAIARSGQRAIVIGGGLLGLEAAKGLLDLGMDVTVLHLKDRVMDQQLDAMGGSFLKNEIEKLGIGIRLNAVLEEISGGEAVESVRLRDGESLAADLVLVCAGVLPDLTLARVAGIPCNRGVLVDDALRTGIPGIFAIGDVVEHRGTCYGLIAPLKEQARVIAHHLLRGGEEPGIRYEGTQCSTRLKVSGIAVVSSGKLEGGSGSEEIVMMDGHRGIYKKFIFQEDRLLGAILVGDAPEGARAIHLIEAGVSADSFRASLLGKAGDPVPGEAEGHELVCLCHGVTRETIVQAVKTKGLTSREEVSVHTKASTGCGGCSQEVSDLVAMHASVPAGPVVSPSPAPMEQPEPVLMRTLLSEYPPAYPKGLEIDRIKKEGLGLDFDEIFEKDIRALSEDDFYRLKTYGICSQKHPGFFMLRIRVPAGRLSSDQAKAVADLSERYAGGWVHVSTRQNFEFHWVQLKNVRTIWETLSAVGLSTRSSCGHTMRNVMACPHGGTGPDAVMDVEPLAMAISDFFVRRSDYINPALPNRLNILFSACPACDPDVAINDLGFRAIRVPGADGRTFSAGFEMWAGGSLGAHPALGFKLKEFVSVRDVLPACEAVFEIYSKFGIRTKAKSRLKWLLDLWGEEKFSRLFEQVFHGKRFLPENNEIPWDDVERRMDLHRAPPDARDHVWFRQALEAGCYPQRQSGEVRVPIHLALGEIRAAQLSGLADLAVRYGKQSLQLTKEQNIEIQDIPVRQSSKLLRGVKRLKLSPMLESANQNVVACPGTEFCVLAVTDAQGVAHSLLQEVAFVSDAASRFFEGIQISVSGCPNSCAKHQIADIGLSGGMTMLNGDRRYSYSLFLGGSMEGGVHLGEVILKGLTEEVVVPVVQDVLECVASHREGSESFYRVVERVGAQRIGKELAGRIQSRRPRTWEKILMECQVVDEENGVLP